MQVQGRILGLDPWALSHQGQILMGFVHSISHNFHRSIEVHLHSLSFSRCPCKKHLLLVTYLLFCERHNFFRHLFKSPYTSVYLNMIYFSLEMMTNPVSTNCGHQFCRYAFCFNFAYNLTSNKSKRYCMKKNMWI